MEFFFIANCPLSFELFEAPKPNQKASKCHPENRPCYIQNQVLTCAAAVAAAMLQFRGVLSLI